MSDFDNDDDLFDEPVCVCGKLKMLPQGDPTHPGLIVFHLPSQTDIALKKFSGNYYSMLAKEAARIGIDFRHIRQTTLYNHPGYTEACVSDSLYQLTVQIDKSTAVLAIGPEVSKALSGNPKIQTAITVPCYYKSTVKLVTAPSLGLVFARSVGELRLALSKFKKALEEETVYE